MPIKTSSAPHIDALVGDLGSAHEATRDAAVARLSVLGARATNRLLSLISSDGDPTARAAALRVLEGADDSRALDSMLNAVDAQADIVAVAAIAAVRTFLRGPRGASVVERLTRVALDGSRGDDARVAALDALSGLEPTTIAPLLTALRDDPRDVVRRAASGAPTPTASARIARAATQELPDTPRELIDALASAASTASIPALLQVIERVRHREVDAPPQERVAWAHARGRVHVELASRGSRVALYDLRETLNASTGPLAVDFLSALSMAGDGSCLEAIADAYARSTAAGIGNERWWRDHLAEVFRAIVEREGITRRQSVVKRIERRMKPTFDELWSGRAGKP